MKEFLASISTVYFWLSVVVVGILINIASSFIQKKLDRQLSTTYDWWANRSEKQKQRTRRIIEKIKDNPHEQTMMAFSEMRLRMNGIGLMVCAICFIAMPIIFPSLLQRVPSIQIILMMFSTCAMSISAMCTIEASKLKHLILKARSLNHSREIDENLEDEDVYNI